MKQIQTFKIHDTEHETAYTAHIEKNGDGWLGWIQESPKVHCVDVTKETVLESLEEDIKVGRLDHLDVKALQDFWNGRCSD